MRTTVVRRRRVAGHSEIAMPCSRPLRAVQVQSRPIRRLPSGDATAAPWSTAKVGLVASTLAAIVAVVADATTALPSHAIVLTVMFVVFALSMHATSRRPPPHR